MTDPALITRAHAQEIGNEVPRNTPASQRVKATAVAWLADPQLSMDEWHSYGLRMSRMSKSANWWLGDWVRFGQQRYGLRYREASLVSGYDEQTLMNLAYVAGRFSTSRRRETISWSHQAEVAKLGSEDQEIWLDRAISEHFSVRRLRSELRALEHGSRSNLDGVGDSATQEGVVVDASFRCPHCGGFVVLSDIAVVTRVIPNASV